MKNLSTTFRKNGLKAKLSKGKLTIGSWLTLSSQETTEIMASEDFDWLAVDMEHSAITLSQAQNLIRIIQLSGKAALVRVGENSPYFIKRAMDAGAQGVIVPMVNSKDDALRAVEAVKYPPIGKRGVGLARAQGYGLEFASYKEWQKKKSVVIVQIEHIDAINNLEEILEVDGVDASIIGPYDLSASLGCPGEFSNKYLQDAIKEYVKVCRKIKKSAGFHVIAPEAAEVKKKIREGFSFIGFSLDSLFLGAKLQQELKQLKKG